jgi:hypothetical protein
MAHPLKLSYHLQRYFISLFIASGARPMIMRWISEVPSKIVKLSGVAGAEQRAC